MSCLLPAVRKPYTGLKMKTTIKNHEVLIDQEDKKLLTSYSWYIDKAKSIYTSYVRGRKKGHGYSEPIYLHRVVMKAKKGQIIDHINGNGLDNRKSNLRFATPAQNQANRVTQGVGVRHRERPKPWQAYYSKNNRFTHIGYFKTKEEALKAREETLIKERGEFHKH